MKRGSVVVENLSLIKNFDDPFLIFGLPYIFFIENLDKIYYELYRKHENKAQINKAYALLKDPIERAKFLCNFYEKTAFDKTIPIKIFELKKNNTNFQELILFLKKEVEKFAIESNWDKCWYSVQLYTYCIKLK